MRRPLASLALAAACAALAAAGAPAPAAASCGDGVVDVGELCDDGNSEDCDGCGNLCILHECGDGIAACDEECDDGNTVDGDGCSASCLYDCAPLTKAELVCILTVNAEVGRLARAQGRDDRRCLRAAARGGMALGDCLGSDPRGRVGRATARLSARAERECLPAFLPPLAFSDAETAAAAAIDAALAGFAAVFGAAPVAALRDLDREAAACQAAVATHAVRVTAAALAELNRAKRPALQGTRESPQVCTGTELAEALDAALAASHKLERAGERLEAAVAKACAGADVGALFDCGGAASAAELATCARAEAVRAACRALEDADQLDLACAD